MGDSKLDPDELRRRAEELLQLKLANNPDVSSMSVEEVRKFIHDLQVRQIELELRNEELHRNVEEERFVSSDGDREYPSGAMQTTLKMARMAAKTDATVLLIGESGSGKGHLARYIHEHSRRALGPYHVLDCAAMAPELTETELFGAEGAAFNGVQVNRRGVLDLSEGGSVLLKQIGDLSLTVQTKLVTFLDTRTITRAGGAKQISVDARLIVATNRDPNLEVNAGRLGKDLFQRLNELTIKVPPLRERCEDIPMLVKEIIEELQQEMQLDTDRSINSFIVKGLQNYGWPGNVSELRSVLRYYLPSKETPAK